MGLSFYFFLLSYLTWMMAVESKIILALLAFFPVSKTIVELRLLPTFTGVLREKIRMRAILKENTAYYILLERLIIVDFGKN